MIAPRRAPGSASGAQHHNELTPAFERLWRALGVDAPFAENVLGDLAEEYAARAVCGAVSARVWYAGQILRSTPYLIRNAGRRAAGRARLAAALAGIALLACAVRVALQARQGPPARLVAGTQDTVLVNFVRPVALPMQVLDAKGRMLPDTGVRYAWLTGAPVSVSRRGVVTCGRQGDATVRASLGPLTTNLLLRCRPVRSVRASYWTDFVLGDSARDLDVIAVGVDGKLVTLLGAWLRVADSTVATRSGLRVHPRAPGETSVALRVGDRTADFVVRVFEPVKTFGGLRADQRLVAAPVRVAPGASVRWPLPTGRFYLSFHPTLSTKSAPLLSVDGAIMCIPQLGPDVYDTRCVGRVPGAWVTVRSPGASPGDGAAPPALVGTLSLHRDPTR